MWAISNRALYSSGELASKLSFIGGKEEINFSVCPVSGENFSLPESIVGKLKCFGLVSLLSKKANSSSKESFMSLKPGASKFCEAQASFAAEVGPCCRGVLSSGEDTKAGLGWRK